MTTNFLDSLRIRQETFVESLECHAELASTNDRALAMAADPTLAVPAIVVAERQSSGRGRGGHVWQSGPGALTFSLILDRPTGLAPERISLVSLSVGLALRAAIAAVVGDSLVQVKWPNDVYLAGKKIAGILTETTASASGRLVVGIGVNVNNSLAGAPAQVRERGISLAAYLGRTIDASDLLVRLLVVLESELNRLSDAGEIDVDRWRPHCFLIGRETRVLVGHQVATGRCQSVSPDGGLLLERDGRVDVVYAGEVLLGNSSVEDPGAYAH